MELTMEVYSKFARKRFNIDTTKLEASQKKYKQII